MKYNLIYIVSLFLSCLLLGCDDKTEDFNGPYSLVVTGSTATTPGSTETYRLAQYDNPSSYTWTVTGPATIVGPTTGLTVKLAFSAIGSVNLSVTNGTDKALFPISVADVSPDAEVALNGSGILKAASKDTIFLSYPAPLKTTPVIKILTATDSSHFNEKELAFSSGTLGPVVKVDDATYYAIYTAGTGNGTPEALITGAVSTDDFGADNVDSLYIQLYQVDNIAPIANLTYSTSTVNKGTIVTVTATFSEPVTFKSPADSALIVSFSGAGITAETDTLVATDNPLVYTYSYKATGTGNGAVTAVLSNITDLAGNDLAVVTSSGGSLVIDNAAPTVSGTATDSGDFATIKVTSSEKGSASYIVLNDTDDAPTSADEFFSADAIASGSTDVAAATQVTLAQLLSSGSYTVYFISQDGAGNYGAIDSASLTMN